MIDRKFVLPADGAESRFYFQGTKEPAPPGLTVVLGVHEHKDDRLLADLQQSTDGKNWEPLGRQESCGLGWQTWNVWPLPGRQVRVVLWTTCRSKAQGHLKLFDNGRSATERSSPHER